MQAFWILLAITIVLTIGAALAIWILVKKLNDAKALATLNEVTKQTALLELEQELRKKELESNTQEANRIESNINKLKQESTNLKEKVNNIKDHELVDEFKKLGY